MKKAKKEDFIEITKRLVSEKIQPHIEVGGRYLVIGNDKLKDGTEVLILNRKNHKEGVRCNAKRFIWKVLSEAEMKRDILQISDKNKKELLNRTFNEKETNDYACIPLVMAEIIWHYAFKLIEYGKAYKLKVLLNGSRNIKHLREQYLNSVETGMPRSEILKFKEQTEMFLNEFSNNFNILFYTASNLIQSQKQVDHADLRAYAYMTIRLIQELIKYEDKISLKMSLKLGKVGYHLPYIDDLRYILESYLDDQHIKTDQNMETGLNIYIKNIKTIDFNIVEE